MGKICPTADANVATAVAHESADLGSAADPRSLETAPVPAPRAHKHVAVVEGVGVMAKLPCMGCGVPSDRQPEGLDDARLCPGQSKVRTWLDEPDHKTVVSIGLQALLVASLHGASTHARGVENKHPRGGRRPVRCGDFRGGGDWQKTLEWKRMLCRAAPRVPRGEFQWIDVVSGT